MVSVILVLVDEIKATDLKQISDWFWYLGDISLLILKAICYCSVNIDKKEE